MAQLPAPTEGIALTHFIVSRARDSKRRSLKDEQWRPRPRAPHAHNSPSAMVSPRVASARSRPSADHARPGRYARTGIRPSPPRALARRLASDVVLPKREGLQVTDEAARRRSGQTPVSGNARSLSGLTMM